MGDDHPGRPGRGQRGEHEAVRRRGHRTVPGQVGAVPATAPAGRPPGRTAQPADQLPDRGGQPPLGCGETEGGAQQVDGEVGGEGDRRFQVGVQHLGPCGDRCRPDGGGHRGPHRRRRGGAGSVGHPVDPQRSRPPRQVGAVGPGTPGAGPPAEPARPALTARRPVGRSAVDRRVRGEAQHAHRQPDRQAGGEVGGQVAVAAQVPTAVPPAQVGGGGEGRPLAEEAEPAGGTCAREGGRVGPPGRCRLDRHRCPPRGVVAAAGEGAAGKEEVTDGGAPQPVPATPLPERVTEPLPEPSAVVDDPPPGPVTCRLHRRKAQVNRRSVGR